MIHKTLTVTTLIALGLLLRVMDDSAIPYYTSAVALFGLECIISLARMTTRVVKFEKTESCGILNIDPFTKDNAAGTFFWISGFPLHTAWQTDDSLVVLVPNVLLNQAGSKQSILVEGPYGPGIGICALLMRSWFLALNALKMHVELSELSRPVQLPKQGEIAFVVETAMIARVFALFYWSRIIAGKKTRLLMFSTNSSGANFNLQKPFFDFLKSNEHRLGVEWSGQQSGENWQYTEVRGFLEQARELVQKLPDEASDAVISKLKQLFSQHEASACTQIDSNTLDDKLLKLIRADEVVAGKILRCLNRRA